MATSWFHIPYCEIPSLICRTMHAGELYHVQFVLNPSKPFVAIVAGAKYDTKIGPLKEIYKKVDKLVLGGLIYNTYLCAKYGVKISGVEESDIELAKELVVQDKVHKKILELQVLVETDTLEGRFEGKFRTIDVKDFAPGQTYKYVVDVDPVSFERDEVKQEMNSAKTIFVNAVMGLMPHFWHGTSKMDEVIDKNCSAQILEVVIPFRLLKGGGTVLKVIEEGDPMGLETVKALIDNKANYSKRSQNN